MPSNATTIAEPLAVVRASEWQPHAAALKHVFLIGNLQRPTPHPFFRRDDFELVVCEYTAGDHGLPHWHRTVDEFDLVISGRVGYRDITARVTEWFEPGDVVSIPHHRCVQRIVDEASRTVTVKVPSTGEKTHCCDCPRACAERLAPYTDS